MSAQTQEKSEYELLTENVRDANYSWSDDPFRLDLEIIWGGLVMDSDQIKNYMKYQTVIKKTDWNPY
jgi:hypothetical protein